MLSFFRAHANADKLHILEDLDAGDIVNIHFLDTNNSILTAKVLIVAVQLTRQRVQGKTPLRKIWGITLEIGQVTPAKWSAGDTWGGPGATEKDFWG